MSKVRRIVNPRAVKLLPMKLYESITVNEDGESTNVKYTIISGDEAVSRFDSFCPENSYDMEQPGSKNGGTAYWDWEEFLSADEGRMEAREKAFLDYVKMYANGRPYQVTLIDEWTEPKRRTNKHKYRQL